MNCPRLINILALILATASGVPADTNETIRLWPGAAPGTEDWKIQERTFQIPTKGSGTLSLVSDITVPTLTVVRPADSKGNGTALIVCPGGGFKFLSWESEGMEVARWLADRGIHAFVLKYRVRSTEKAAPAEKSDRKTFDDHLKAAEAKIDIARADAIQAIRHLRANADKYGIARDRIGLMGFSAGAMTTLSVVLKADAESWPNFATSIYGAMEDVPVPKDAPPLFIVHTQEDAMVPAAQATKVFNAWTAAGRRAEMHLYQAGPHGFGMRRVGSPVDGWTDAFESWLRAGKLLDRQTVGPTDKTETVTWKLSFNPGDSEHEATLTITKEGSGLKAAYKDGDRKFEVTRVELKDGKLHFSTETKRDGEKATARFEAKIEGDVINGEANWDYQGMSGSFPFTGNREAAKP
jgi:acetyl esterase/lipase